MILDSFKDFTIVRDDLYPFPGGGNKARKAIEYESFLRLNNYNAVVTTGGVQSNHCRAVAIMATRNNWKCHIVYHGSKDRFFKENGNALLVRKTNATFEFVEAANISSSMDSAMEELRLSGFNPYYITGGGHDLPGGVAYVKAVKELQQECKLKNWYPDVIFLASGTGSTQAGILAGLNLYGWGDVEVVGISVARKYERGVSVISDFLKELQLHLAQKNDLSDKVLFDASYLAGGYESFSVDMEEYINSVTLQTGVFFDTTYSGKALWGMYNILKNRYQNKNVLFWHTGGLMNLMK